MTILRGYGSSGQPVLFSIITCFNVICLLFVFITFVLFVNAYFDILVYRRCLVTDDFEKGPFLGSGEMGGGDYSFAYLHLETL